jgi:hypothetical protein
MPVEFDSYTTDQGRLDLSEGTNARAILTLLLEHPGVGFTPAEIHEETGIPKGSVNPTLGRLERAGLVRHKEPYWAAADDERIAAASAAVLGVRTVGTHDDWYAQNDDWAENLPDISESEDE